MPWGFGNQPSADAIGERREGVAHQLSGGGLVERTDLQQRDSGLLEVALLRRAQRSQETDTCALEPVSDEAEHLCAPSIEPGEVVDDDDQRMIRRG